MSSRLRSATSRSSRSRRPVSGLYEALNAFGLFGDVKLSCTHSRPSASAIVRTSTLTSVRRRFLTMPQALRLPILGRSDDTVKVNLST